MKEITLKDSNERFQKKLSTQTNAERFVTYSKYINWLQGRINKVTEDNKETLVQYKIEKYTIIHQLVVWARGNGLKFKEHSSNWNSSLIRQVGRLCDEWTKEENHEELDILQSAIDNEKDFGTKAYCWQLLETNKVLNYGAKAELLQTLVNNSEEDKKTSLQKAIERANEKNTELVRKLGDAKLLYVKEPYCRQASSEGTKKAWEYAKRTTEEAILNGKFELVTIQEAIQRNLPMNLIAYYPTPTQPYSLFIGWTNVPTREERIIENDSLDFDELLNVQEQEQTKEYENAI